MSVEKTGGGKWIADVRDADGRRHRKRFRTEKAARAYERGIVDMREQGVSPERGNGTLNDFIPEWKAAHYPGVRENTRQGYESALRRHIQPGLGAVKLRRLDERTVQQWIIELSAAGLSARTVEFQFTVLSTVIKQAAAYGLCKPLKRAGRNGAGVRLPKQIPTITAPPNVAEIELLAAVIDPRFAALVRIAGYCGLRQSECFGLGPAHLDFDKKRILVCRTIEHASRRAVDLTKNGKTRVVTMLGPVEASLALQLREYPHSEFVFHAGGKHLDSSHFNRDIWAPARTQAGLPELEFRALRHSAPSIMAQLGGWGPKKVQIEMGHHSASFTLDRYSHVFAENEDSARTVLNEALYEAIADAKQKTKEQA
jgi:integrase